MNVGRAFELEPEVEGRRVLPWLGVAALAASWLPGLGLYRAPEWGTWAVLLAAGTLLLGGVRTLPVGRLPALVATLLCLPMIGLVPAPYKAAPVLIVLGAGATALQPPRRWLAGLATGTLAAGLVLLAQALGMLAYQGVTARSHELPTFVARGVGAIGGLLGIDVAVAETTPAGGGGVDIAIRSMRKVHHLGATWELLLDPLTVGFIIGAAVIILTRGGSSVLRSLAALLGCALLWVPIRVGLLMALITHRALRTDFDAPVHVMDAFWSAWVLLAMVVPLALLAWRFVGWASDSRELVGEAHPASVWLIVRPTLFALAVASFSVAVFWDPIGVRKPGRVVVDEYHSKWEPTTRPYDTNWYGHESGYNYAAIYDYSDRFYDMSRLHGPIDNKALAGVDVFVLKCPTQRLRIDEVERLKQFVADGGGLLLVGEHTDVFGMGTNLNDVARQFGFQFRYDVLFSTDDEKPFDYRYEKPLVPHPIVQRMPPLDFEGPCTIEPTGGRGRSVMTAVGQRSEVAHYHASNFMPPPEDRADARYGAWTVCWATKYGKGRVVAHGDSTQWSNFSAFEPGKPESWIGMLEWLNHRNGPVADPRWAFILLGAALLGGYFVVGRYLPQVGPLWGGPLIAICAGLSAFAVSAVAVRAAHSDGMPVPAHKPNAAPTVMVGIDRTVSNALLSKGGFIGGKAEGYGIFERWILRLGHFIQRGSGSELFKDKQLVVFFAPDGDVSDEFRGQLVEYVANGGRVLIIDTPENGKSTANSLLKPFGLELRRPVMTEITGTVDWPMLGLPACQVTGSYEVVGGHRVLATAGGRPVAATSMLGNGTVTVIGFGSRFNDANFGVTGDVVPNEELRRLYDVQFGLLRHLVGAGPTTRPTTSATRPR